ncbi:MAG: sulfite exporter TauE/SafE family protein [Thiothrix sp.]|nr:sulfite exporter TauE/SafE family protein [Thiothrix sp.]
MVLPLEGAALLAAVAAVVIVGISKGGFGGNLGLLGVPLMALVMSPVKAAAIMLPILCFMDLMALRAWWGRWDLLHVRRMLPAAMLGILIGALGFRHFNADHVKLIIGVLAIGFALNHWFKPARHWQRGRPGRVAGMFWGGVTGFTSFVSHSGGPPANIYLLPQGLDKAVFQSTMVLVFIGVNYVKLVPYTLLGQFNTENLWTSLFLLPVAAAGVLLGVWLHRRVPEKLFFQLAYVLLFLTGIKLIRDGAGVLFG